MADNILAFDVKEFTEFMFIAENQPFILTVSGIFKMMRGGEGKFVQSLKVERRTEYANSLANIEDYESILDHYYITHTIIKLCTI